MIDIKDAAKFGGFMVGLAALTTVGLAGAYLMTRDPATLRRVVRFTAGSLERASAAIAEAREEIEDMWAEAREEARQAMDDAAFTAAGTAQSEEPGSNASGTEEAKEKSGKSSRKPRRNSRRTAASPKGEVSS